MPGRARLQEVVDRVRTVDGWRAVAGIAGVTLVTIAARRSAWTTTITAAVGGLLIGRSLFVREGVAGLTQSEDAPVHGGTSGERSSFDRAAPQGSVMMQTAARPFKDEVDRASDQSFPASDPPGYSSSTGAPKP